MSTMIICDKEMSGYLTVNAVITAKSISDITIDGNIVFEIRKGNLTLVHTMYESKTTTALPLFDEFKNKVVEEKFYSLIGLEVYPHSKIKTLIAMKKRLNKDSWVKAVINTANSLGGSERKSLAHRLLPYGVFCKYEEQQNKASRFANSNVVLKKKELV